MVLKKELKVKVETLGFFGKSLVLDVFCCGSHDMKECFPEVDTV